MLTLTPDQVAAIEQADTRGFVVQVADDMIGDYPSMADDPGRPVVIERMTAAYERTRSLGFTSTPHVIKFMRAAAIADRFYDQPGADEWLRKPGQTPEQRFDDLYAVIASKIGAR